MIGKILSVLFIFLISYFRNTFLINPNLKDESFLIYSWNYQATQQLSLISMLCYIFLFGLGNYFIARSFIKEKSNLWMIVYLMFVIIITVLYGIYLISDYKAIFSIGSIIKNFLLSPVFPVLVFIFFKVRK